MLSETYLLAYPRSGSTWMWYLLEQLTGTAASDPGVDSRHGGIASKMQAAGREEATRFLEQNAEYLRRAPGFIKCHYARELPGNPDKESRLLFLYRDPREVVTAYVISSRFGSLSLPEAMACFLSSPEFLEGLEEMRRQVQSFVSWPGRKLAVRYRELVVDPGVTVARLAEWLSLDQERVQDVLRDLPRHQQQCMEFKVSSGKLRCNTVSAPKDMQFYRRHMPDGVRDRVEALYHELFRSLNVGAVLTETR